ncbi:Mss4-like protein [Crucibulum laeve]|uniref:Mss4-like protein n=1 Tax=Crucibulum laeve TaxID=68775 RepID=A0A5C3LGU9_9AGAR|nr:Mss4-like protein [Crucibulum laeve]
MTTTYVPARCHCGKNTFKVAFPSVSLPTISDLCHCDACRHTTGQMAVCVVRIQGVALSATSTPDSEEPADISGLSQYQTSNRLTRYFCSTCSAHVLEYSHEFGNWSVTAGALERTDGIVNIGFHIYVGDTLDGGLSDHYRTHDGVEVPRYIEDKGSDMVPLGWKADVLKQKHENEGEDRLFIYCHCKKNQYYLTRVKEVKDAEQEWWLKPSSNESELIKYLGTHCVCTSCRLTSGFEIQSWMFLPRENIIDPATNAVINFTNPAARPKGLTQYTSTPEKEIHREFCGTCGATVFFWLPGRDIVDVSLGTVDQGQRGARAEGWIEWRKRVTQSQDAINPRMLKALMEGVEAVE